MDSHSFRFRFSMFVEVFFSLLIIMVMFSPSPARAVTINEFAIASKSWPGSIIAGPDGNLWFTEIVWHNQYPPQNHGALGRITTSGTVTEFPWSTDNIEFPSIVAGPDGNLWFFEWDRSEMTSDQIGRITPAGVITEFPLPTADLMTEQITVGPDGNLWFNYGTVVSDTLQIGRMTPAGVVTAFPLPTASDYPGKLVTGPDGNLWFTVYGAGDGRDKIGRITTAGVITEFPLPLGDSISLPPLLGSENGGLTGPIIDGPDGNLWFTENGAVARITTGGVITKFPLSGGFNVAFPRAITAGPDGNIWFTEQDMPPGLEEIDSIVRITPGGVITKFPLPSEDGPAGILMVGPDGNLWFTEGDSKSMGFYYQSVTGKIGRITPTGVITEFPLSENYLPQGMAVGPDGNIWFTEGVGDGSEAGSAKIGQIVLNSATMAVPTPATSAVFPSQSNAQPQQASYYADMTSAGSDPSKAVPFWVWEQGPTEPDYTSQASDPVHFELNIGNYAGPVDVYFALSVPSITSEVYLFGSDGGLYPVSAGWVKYRSSVRSLKTDVLTLTAGDMAGLKAALPGPWYFYTLIVPAGNIDKEDYSSFYLWQMEYQP